MTGHKIYVTDKTRGKKHIDPRDIRDAVSFTLDAEDIGFPCQVSVLVTDDEGIRQINKAQRRIDAATDVLSFPLQDFDLGKYDNPEYDLASGRVPLGDIVLSAERVRAQAKEYGNTVGRETAYLTVHSALHLLAYDHADEGNGKAYMRTREKEIMRHLGYPDDDDEFTEDEDFEEGLDKD